MNVFATLKTVFFGSKFLSNPVPSDGTPRRDLVFALNRLMPLCRTIPGVHLAVDIREGQVALVLDYPWCAPGGGYPRGPSGPGAGLDSARRREGTRRQLPLHRVQRGRSEGSERIAGSSR